MAFVQEACKQVWSFTFNMTKVLWLLQMCGFFKTLHTVLKIMGHTNQENQTKDFHDVSLKLYSHGTPITDPGNLIFIFIFSY